MNDTDDFDTGISASTLAYGVYPKFSGRGPRVTMIHQSNIIRSCTEMLMRFKAQCTIREAQKIKYFASQSEMEQVGLNNLQAQYLSTGKLRAGNSTSLCGSMETKIMCYCRVGKLRVFQSI